ncbi:MAG: Fe2+-dependent dioxygenase [Bacillota bacterium]
MLLKIDGLLSTAEVGAIRTALADVKFEDGRATAGVAVRDVKKNLQVTPQEQKLEESRRIVTAALLKCEPITQLALPRRVLPPMFNRYDAGMEYGSHVDNAIMGGGDPMRADLSVTVFISDPKDYDGGALVINSDAEAASVKMAAGSAVVYNSTSIHRVEPVTRGSRIAAVTWVQSFVREEARRDILLDLMDLARWARNQAPGSVEAMKLSKIRANLMRMWSEL